jgi:hypothetical protein
LFPARGLYARLLSYDAWVGADVGRNKAGMRERNTAQVSGGDVDAGADWEGSRTSSAVSGSGAIHLLCRLAPTCLVSACTYACEIGDGNIMAEDVLGTVVNDSDDIEKMLA